MKLSIIRDEYQEIDFLVFKNKQFTYEKTKYRQIWIEPVFETGGGFWNAYCGTAKEFKKDYIVTKI